MPTNTANKRETKKCHFNNNFQLNGAPRNQMGAVTRAKNGSELTVCDITGAWGAYQWSLCLFAIIYSSLTGIIVVFGPILTPQMEFKCNQTNSNFNQSRHTLINNNETQLDNRQQQHECFKTILSQQDGQPITQDCTNFLYNDQALGLTLTNSVSTQPFD